MNGAMKMMMLSSRGREGNQSSNGGRMYNTYDAGNQPRTTYMNDEPRDEGRSSPRSGGGEMRGPGSGVYDRYDGPQYNGDDDDMESRGYKRDSRGRFRSELEDSYALSPRVLPMFPTERPKMGRIGFSAGGEMGWDSHMGGGETQDDDMSHGHSDSAARRGHVRSMKLTQDMAEEWMDGLQNEDGTRGPHWSMAQTKQVMSQKGIDADPIQFYAALNMIYSDYYKVLKKYGLADKMDVYVDLACAWLNDRDAVRDKAGAYFAYAVRH